MRSRLTQTYWTCPTYYTGQVSLNMMDGSDLKWDGMEWNGMEGDNIELHELSFFVVDVMEAEVHAFSFIHLQLE